MRFTRRLVPPALFLTVAALAVGCSDSQDLPTDARTDARGERGGPPVSDAGPYEFDSPVFDIEAAPNGNVLVAETVLGGVADGSTTVWELLTRDRRSGKRKISEFTTPGGVTPIHGMAAIGQRDIVAARGGLDLAANAAVVRITPAGSRVVADVSVGRPRGLAGVSLRRGHARRPIRRPRRGHLLRAAGAQLRGRR